MRKCSNCFKHEGTHRWGKWALCDNCHKHFNEKLQSTKDTPDIKISEKSNLRGYGEYYHGKSVIEIHRVGGTLEVTIAHETIHHVLNILIGPSTSYDYDNISGEGEIHQKLFAVLSKRR